MIPQGNHRVTATARAQQPDKIRKATCVCVLQHIELLSIHVCQWVGLSGTGQCRVIIMAMNNSRTILRSYSGTPTGPTVVLVHFVS